MLDRRWISSKLVMVVLLVLILGACLLYRSRLQCRRGGFDAQVDYWLSQEMLSPEEIQRVTQNIDQLQDTLRIRWKGANLYAYGSVLSGLATKTSDVDFYLKLPRYKNNVDAYIVNETAKLLYTHPEKYNNIVLHLGAIVPMMTFHDISMQRNIDLSFRSSAGVDSTKLFTYVLNLDKRYLPLTVIIKYWCQVRQLTGRRELPNYAVYLLVMFYLQQRNMLPSGQQIQAQSPAPMVDKWNFNIEQIPYKVENKQSLYELLGGFFNYYSTFNFTQYCVSGFVARPILRSEFQHVDTIPREFTLYKSYLQIGKTDPLPLHNTMCIQDIFEHNKNVARRVHYDIAMQFISQVKITAKMYNESSCQQFLKDILLNNTKKKLRRGS